MLESEDGCESADPHEPTGRLAESVSKVISYHVQEYDLTAATVVGVLAMETIRRALDAMKQGDDESEDDEYEEDESP